MVKAKAKITKKKVVKEEQACIIDYQGKKMAVTGIRASAGVTVNMGDFESARLDFSVSVAPCDPNTSLIEMEAFAWDFVKGSLAAEVKALPVKGKKTGNN